MLHAAPDGGHPRLLVAGEPFLVLGGEVHNSSASTANEISRSCEAVAKLGLNTVLAPVCWEDVEPEEGRFDFSLLDHLLAETRRLGLRLIPLWFATYKNASSSYAPAWVKTDTQRFPRVQTSRGKAGTTISPHAREAAEADAHAFAAVMAHLAEVDAEHRTVVMVQVQNETGLLRTARDRSPLAEEAFGEGVPADLMTALGAMPPDPREREWREAWEAAGSRTEGSWSEVFGGAAEEVFTAWHVARYVERVAAAGRAAYDVPLFTNAWIKAGPGYRAGEYPSGGPVAGVLGVWQIAAPSIDFLAPDIYQATFREVCAAYDRPGNPLLVPESPKDRSVHSRLLYVLGEHRGLGLAPFGADRMDDPGGVLARVCDQLSQMTGLVTEAQARGATRGFLQPDPHETLAATLEGHRFTARSWTGADPIGPINAALLLALGDDEYLMLGHGLRIDLDFPGDADTAVEVLEAHEGRFEEGQWRPERRLNGDETDHGLRLLLGPEPTLIRFRLYRYR